MSFNNRGNAGYYGEDDRMNRHQPAENGYARNGKTYTAKELYEQRKNGMDMTPHIGQLTEYYVEHLVSFTIEKKAGLLTVEDSIRKLKLQDAKGKISAHDVCLRVDDASVKVIDSESMDELEHFSMLNVQHVQPVKNSSPNYKNLLALVVKSPHAKTAEINLYNCPNISATIISEDIGSALKDIGKKNKKIRPDTLGRPPHQTAREKQKEQRADVRARVAQWTRAIQSAQNELPIHDGYRPPPRKLISGGSSAAESPDMIAFKIHRDVEMLNYSIDDIESTVTALNKAAEASRELQLMRMEAENKKGSKSKGSSKKSSKNKSGTMEKGIRMLKARARLPSPEHFIDCFQKFKFCFNLLTKLKGHLENPNAVELVHFLFQPLDTILQACPITGLAQSVQFPLLTKETLDWFDNCLTTVETRMHGSLGQYWNKCRADFPKDHFFPPYIPVFKSGWEPPALPYPDSTEELSRAIADQADIVQQRIHNDPRIHRDSVDSDYIDYNRPPSTGSSLASSSLHNDFSDHNDSRNTPRHIVVPPPPQQQQQAPPPQRARSPSPPPRKVCRAMYDFDARNEHELTVRMDDLLDVVDDSSNWWRVKNREGNVGYVPADLMLLITSATRPAGKSYNNVPTPPPIVPTQQIGYIPPPPPPPPPPQTSTHPPVQQVAPMALANVKQQLKPARPNNNRQSPPNHHRQDSLQEELKRKVEQEHDRRRRNFVVPKKADGNAKLSTSATPLEVRQWLRKQGFSALTVDSLGVLNGQQLFSLKKEELIMICEDEGSRVHSQLLVQKAEGGDRNPFEDDELDKILKARRKDITASGGANMLF